MISLSKRKEGFTIVELLIVIVVIGILAGLVITTYNGIQQKARNTERQTDLKAVQGQLEAYYATNGYYPVVDNTSDGAGLGSNSDGNVAFIKANMKGLDKEALRDPSATAGNYSLAATATSDEYSYTSWNDPGDGTKGTCDDSATLCNNYEISAKQEGSSNTYTYDSLN